MVLVKHSLALDTTWERVVTGFTDFNGTRAGKNRPGEWPSEADQPMAEPAKVTDQQNAKSRARL